MSKTIVINDISDLSKLSQPTIPDGTPAADVRRIHLEHAKTCGYPEFEVTGRTFPLRKLIWVHGGRWDKEAKAQFVPAHVWIKIQQAVNAITAKVEASIAECAIKRQAKAEAEAAAKAKAEATKAKRAETARKNLEKARAAKAAKAQAVAG
jgi:hypothetical protein